MLKSLITKLEDVAEDLRQHYKEAPAGTTGFVLDQEGVPMGFVTVADAAENINKVKQFRDNNIALTKEVETLRPLKTQFEGIDATAAKEALAKVEELRKKGVDKPDDITTAIASALKQFTTEVVEPLRIELSSEKKAREDADLKVDDATLRTVVGEKFIEMGGQAGALSFILGKANETFQVVDGNVVAKPNKFSTDSPGNLIEAAEWLTQQSRAGDASFAFKSSNGGGADGGSGDNKPIAGVKDLVDPTPAELGKNMDAISNRTMRVVTSS